MLPKAAVALVLAVALQKAQSNAFASPEASARLNVLALADVFALAKQTTQSAVLASAFAPAKAKKPLASDVATAPEPQKIQRAVLASAAETAKTKTPSAAAAVAAPLEQNVQRIVFASELVNAKAKNPSAEAFSVVAAPHGARQNLVVPGVVLALAKSNGDTVLPEPAVSEEVPKQSMPPVAPGATVLVEESADTITQPGPARTEPDVEGAALAKPPARNQAAKKATENTANSRAIRPWDPSEGPTKLSLVLINPHLLVR